jgi:heme A synthase
VTSLAIGRGYQSQEASKPFKITLKIVCVEQSSLGGLSVVQLLKPIVDAIQLLLVPICFISAWAIVLLSVWSVWSAVRETALKAKQLHQIPCSTCRFFTSSYHLKCTVRPSIALTEEAINCPDYEPSKPNYDHLC